MKFEWDPDKAASNHKKHGVDVIRIISARKATKKERVTCEKGI